MKILLLGDYSNLHWTLAEGLRRLGHEATVVSDGDYWKGYRRDVNLKRRSTGRLDSLRYVWDCIRLLPRLKGYDVVQLINPLFLDLKPEKILPFYKYIRKRNGKMFVGAFGMDYYWVKKCLDCRTFRYSDFNIGPRSRADEPQNRRLIDEWLNGAKGRLCQRVMEDCDGIPAGLYEYFAVYWQWFPEKTRFIPMPVKQGMKNEELRMKNEELRMKNEELRMKNESNSYSSFRGKADILHSSFQQGDRGDGGAEVLPLSGGDRGGLTFFIGIQRGRSAYKGTDVMLRALERVKAKYPERCEVVKAESVPFEQYKRMMADSDVLLDQLYSYTPAMNALLAMAQGLVVVGGGEPENYEILGETELRPIVNVLPSEDDVFLKLENLVLHPEQIPLLKRQGLEYVRRYHDPVKVAERYLDFWQQTPPRRQS